MMSSLHICDTLILYHEHITDFDFAECTSSHYFSVYLTQRNVKSVWFLLWYPLSLLSERVLCWPPRYCQDTQCWGTSCFPWRGNIHKDILLGKSGPIQGLPAFLLLLPHQAREEDLNHYHTSSNGIHLCTVLLQTGERNAYIYYMAAEWILTSKAKGNIMLAWWYIGNWSIYE